MRGRISGTLNYVLSEGLGPFLVRAVAGSGAVQIAGMLVTFLVGVQLARGLGVEGYGYYGIAMAVIAIAGVPGEYGIPKLVTREVAAASAHDDRPRMFGVLRWADMAAYAIAALSLVAALVLAIFLSAERSLVATAILWGLPVVPLIAFARIRGGALQGLHNVVLGQVPFNLLRPLLLSLMLFALFHWHPDAAAPEAMALNVVTAAAALLLSELWLRQRLPAEKPAKLVRSGRQWLASSIPMALADGMRIMSLQLAILFLGILATSAEVGLFRIAASIVVMAAVPIALVNRVVSPVIAKLFAQGDIRRLQQLCTRAAQVMAAAVLALTLPFVFFGEPLISFIFGDEFGPAYLSVLILCAGQIISASFGPNASLLVMTGHERRVTRAMFIALAVNIAIVLIAAPLWGSAGAAVAAMGFLITWNGLAWLDAKRLLRVDTSLLPSSRAAFPPKAS